ncbi:SRPBCC family protein [Actinomycetes bacterium M1A6_2h]
MSSNTFLVERSTVVEATPETVHALIDNFHRWESWSPYEGVDPDLNKTFSGPDEGVGASYSWSGNRKAGAGTMTITESVPGRTVVLDLHFTKPFAAQNVTTFTIEPRAGHTLVRWQMTGQQNVFFKLFGFLFSMDKLVGKDFEKGLASLKARAEED